jgi:uncharacterized repeat protein (TIGR03943 family)
MRRDTQNVLLVLLGGALCKIALNGSYLRYVKPSLLPFLVGAGVVILALGLISIARDMRAGRGPAGHHDHDHAGRSPWLLVLPVLAIFLVAPPALGADTVARSTPVAAPQQPAIRFSPLPAEPAPALSMNDFLTRAVWDEEGTLNGRQVQLTGFIVHDAGTTYLGRLIIACCAADAKPVKVRLEGRPGLSELPQEHWFEVRGQLVPDSAGPQTSYTPTLTVTALHPIPTPARPYEF